MADTTYVFVDAVTGAVRSTWQGDTARRAAPATPSGQAAIEVALDQVVDGKRWTGAAFEAAPASARIVALRDFMRRLTLDEQGAFDALTETDGRARVWWQRLIAGDTVDLDHQELVAGLAYVAALGVPSIWPDTATATQRVAEIRS